MPSQELKGARAKIKRAKEHVRKIDALIGRFLDRRPYRVVTEEDLVSRDELYKVRVLRYPSLRWSTIIGDAVQNLRTALDYLAWQLVIANRGRTDKDIYFPIDRDMEKLKASSLRKIQGTSGIWQADIRALRMIQKLKPYKGGDPSLSRLHALSIADKHETILVVGAAYRGFRSTLKWTERLKLSQEELIDFLTSDRMTPTQQFPLKDQAILHGLPAVVRRGGTVQEDTELTFYIAFGESQVVKGEPVIDTLHEFVNVVERIIDEFDRAFFSLLP